jgi:hypothetical protein
MHIILKTPWNSAQWNTIKEILQDEKRKFSDRWDIRKWINEEAIRERKYGDNYGFDLLSPYTDVELDEICTRNNIVLPEPIEYYLRNVSREFIFDSYPVVFTGELCEDDDTSSPLYSGCDIPENQSNLNFDDMYADDEIATQLIFTGMAEIGNGGCSYKTWIVVKGNHYGSIWCRDDEEIYKIHNTLYEYIYDKLFSNKLYITRSALRIAQTQMFTTPI